MHGGKQASSIPSNPQRGYESVPQSHESVMTSGEVRDGQFLVQTWMKMR